MHVLRSLEYFVWELFGMNSVLDIVLCHQPHVPLLACHVVAAFVVKCAQRMHSLVEMCHSLGFGRIGHPTRPELARCWSRRFIVSHNFFKLFFVVQVCVVLVLFFWAKVFLVETNVLRKSLFIRFLSLLNWQNHLLPQILYHGLKSANGLIARYQDTYVSFTRILRNFLRFLVTLYRIFELFQVLFFNCQIVKAQHVNVEIRLGFVRVIIFFERNLLEETDR